MIFSLTKVSLCRSIATALVLAGTAGLPAIAQPIQPSTPQLDTSLETPTETDELTEPAQSEISTAHYADEKISVNYPATWQLKMLDDGILISSDATVPTELVATQVVRMAAPPGAVVNANIESFKEEGSAVARYSRATIDGHDALVMWLADRPDELGSAIATFIGYDNETVLLFSRYAPENTAAEADILQIHTSFTDPAATVALPENTTSPNTTAENLIESDPAEVDSAESSTTELKPIEDNEGEVIVPANGLSGE